MCYQKFAFPLQYHRLLLVLLTDYNSQYTSTHDAKGISFETPQSLMQQIGELLNKAEAPERYVSTQNGFETIYS
jgi:hypothetical protein